MPRILSAEYRRIELSFPSASLPTSQPPVDKRGRRDRARHLRTTTLPSLPLRRATQAHALLAPALGGALNGHHGPKKGWTAKI
ncbi:hypothetical protein FJTKL_01527 [Diaporthe vaccinii]|uniref:Uncharacterized protein n=1 Tax=Diaporthe vaccinii TaxID=105482 RepID=A0ABR4E0C6_9PEZI